MARVRVHEGGRRGAAEATRAANSAPTRPRHHARRSRGCPGFFNHKYRPAPIVAVDCTPVRRAFTPQDFPWSTAVEPGVAGAVHFGLERVGRRERQEWARRYLASIPPAVAGKNGDLATFKVCCRLVRGFALDDDSAMSVLREWNRACAPPWSASELRAKVAGARRYGREPFGGLLRCS